MSSPHRYGHSLELNDSLFQNRLLGREGFVLNKQMEGKVMYQENREMKGKVMYQIDRTNIEQINRRRGRLRDANIDR